MQTLREPSINQYQDIQILSVTKLAGPAGLEPATN